MHPIHHTAPERLGTTSCKVRCRGASQRGWNDAHVLDRITRTKFSLQMSDRDRDHDESMSSQIDEPSSDVPSILRHAVENSGTQHDIDLLFGTPQETRNWEPARPPPALGELLDSRYMLPLLFPSDPRMLAAASIDRVSSSEKPDKQRSTGLMPDARSTDSNTGDRTMLQWRPRNRKVRDVGVETLQWVDGNRSPAHWAESFELPQEDQDDRDGSPSYISDDLNLEHVQSGISQNHHTPLTRKPSARSKGRQSLGETTSPIEP